MDALVARDRHDRPVIWASHLEGVLRDAAHRLRGNDAAGQFFGHKGGHRQRAIFTSLYATSNPESHIWRSTASKAFDNRSPKDDTLRAIEYVPKGTEFVGHVELPVSQLDILKMLLHEVDSLGAGRASGAGRVKFTLSDDQALPRAIGTPTEHLLLLLKNRDPLCVTATATPDNLIPSLAYLPGRTLLGAVAAWLIAEGERDTAALLTSGKASVGDALPLPHAPMQLEGVDVLPAPLSLQGRKPEGMAGDTPWWAQKIAPTQRLDTWTVEEKLKRPEDDLFLCREDANGTWTAYRPARRVRLRNGRPEGPGQVDASLFAIEQIVEGTYFIAALHGPVEDLKQLAEKLAPVLDGSRWLRVGRGGAPVEVARIAWGGAVSPAKAEAKGLLTLTSDLLALDEQLRWRTALDEAAMKDVLGTDVQLGKSIQDSVMVHGFNGTSRLWRMPAAAIRRGSVFEVSGPGVAQLTEQAARSEWLGERTHEGFGRFRIDPVLPGVTSGNYHPDAPQPIPDIPEEAIAVRTQGWFKAHASLAKPGSSTDPKPSISQWFDLVGEMDAKGLSALTNRLNPTTAGGRSWKHRDARMVLEKIQAVPQPAVHARLFVRWLRAEQRKNKDQ